MRRTYKKWLGWGGLSLIIMTSFYFLLKEKLSSVNIQTIAGFLRSLGPLSAVLGFSFIVLQTFFPVIPFLVLAGANVLVFGLWKGFMINWLSAVSGSLLMFFAARTFARGWAERKLEGFPKIRQINHYLKNNGFKSVFLLRIFPVVPPVFINLTAGVSQIKRTPYIAATCLGKLPAIFLESLLGNDLFHFADNKLRFFLVLIGFGILLLVGMKVVRKKLNRGF